MPSVPTRDKYLLILYYMELQHEIQRRSRGLSSRPETQVMVPGVWHRVVPKVHT